MEFTVSSKSLPGIFTYGSRLNLSAPYFSFQSYPNVLKNFDRAFCCFPFPLKFHEETLSPGPSALSRPLGHTNCSNKVLIQTFLHADKNYFSDGGGVYRNLLLLTLRFIHEISEFC